MGTECGMRTGMRVLAQQMCLKRRTCRFCQERKFARQSRREIIKI